ncbi:MAG: hypothetical protein N3A38_16890 [Planctomycetota bacterium]|nr:hypothetical protein [Planctomycetota bacterium]
MRGSAKFASLAARRVAGGLTGRGMPLIPQDGLARIVLRSKEDGVAATKPGLREAAYTPDPDQWPMLRYGSYDIFNFLRVRAVPMPADSKYAAETNAVVEAPATGSAPKGDDDPEATSTVLAGHVVRIVIEGGNLPEPLAIRNRSTMTIFHVARG